jgi:protein involved in polysaccharide export with SLBB domain
MMRLRKSIALMMLVGLMASAPEARPQPTSDVADPGDVLQITVYAGGEKQDDFTATVSPERTITCPLIGVWKLVDAGTTEIAARLGAALAQGYYLDPQVLVSVKEHGAKIFVLGEVKKPGVFALRDGPTALSACVLAGGFTDFASPRRVKITRLVDGKPKLIQVDLIRVQQGKAHDLPLRDGDRIEVPQRWF